MEWYNDHAPDEELTELPAQKDTLRISDREKAIQPSYLYDSDKDDRKKSPIIRNPTHHNRAMTRGDRGHTTWQISYTPTKPKTRSHAPKNAHHKTTITKSVRTRTPNTPCIWTTEVEENTCTTTPGTSNFTRSGNPDSNSKKATGQRIITTSDQVKTLSETMPTENGTRLLTLDHTL